MKTTARRHILVTVLAAMASLSVGCHSAVEPTATGPSPIHAPSSPAPSAASALSEPTGAPIEGPPPGQTARVKLDSGRSYLVHVPKNYTADSQWPLVVAFHGWRESDKAMAAYTRFSEANAIVVYAQGKDSSWVPAPYASASVDDDLDYVDDIVDTVRRTWNVDNSRIYAVGMSNGGGFAQYLSCARSEIFAATASVSGAFYSPVVAPCESATHARDAKSVPRLDIHGTNDPIISHTGGRRHSARYLSIDSVLKTYSALNSCSGSTEIHRLTDSVVEMNYTQCAATLTHIRVGGGPHVWPGSPRDSSHSAPDNFATNKVLDFFQIPRHSARS